MVDNIQIAYRKYNVHASYYSAAVTIIERTRNQNVVAVHLIVTALKRRMLKLGIFFKKKKDINITFTSYELIISF